MIDYKEKYLEQKNQTNRVAALAIIAWVGFSLIALIIVLSYELNPKPNASKTKESTPTVGTEATSQTIGKESRCEFLSYTSMEETNKSLP